MRVSVPPLYLVVVRRVGRGVGHWLLRVTSSGQLPVRWMLPKGTKPWFRFYLSSSMNISLGQYLLACRELVEARRLLEGCVAPSRREVRPCHTRTP